MNSLPSLSTTSPSLPPGTGASPRSTAITDFANMVSWNHYAHYRKAVAGDHLILSSTVNGETRFRFPIGPRDPRIVREVLRLSLEAGGSTPFVVFNGEDRNYLQEVCPDLLLHPYRGFFEYVYRSSDLADLPGKPYLKIRHQLNRFHRRCTYATEPLGEENGPEVREFLERWCDWRDCETDPVLSNEREAILYSLGHRESPRPLGAPRQGRRPDSGPWRSSRS